MQPRHDTPVSVSAAEILGESSRTEARTALAGRLSDFDWQKVSQVLEWSDFLDRKHYRGLFRELSRLFMLKVEDGDYRGDQLSPSGACDVAWHALLMFPKDYAALCRTLGGEMLDHDPLISRSVHYVRTVALYRATFLDEPPALFWESDVVDGEDQARASLADEPAGLAQPSKRKGPDSAELHYSSKRSRELQARVDDSTFRVSIEDASKASGGTVLHVLLQDADTTEDLKELLSETVGLPARGQRLVLGGVELLGGETIKGHLAPGEAQLGRVVLTRKMLGC